MDILLEAQKLLDQMDENRDKIGDGPLSEEDISHLRKVHALEDSLAEATSRGVAPEQVRSILSEAQKLHRAEMQRFQDRQRRREERHMRVQEIQSRVSEENVRVAQWRKEREERDGGGGDGGVMMTMMRLFAELQMMVSGEGDNHLQMTCPEMVVVGMQSDGKSTFVEALLGFTFNVVSSNIGTRRPLILQMQNNKNMSEPKCTFRLEHATGAGNEDQYEKKDTPVDKLSAEITRRTNEIAGSDKNRVSAKPIVLRVQYSKCANLTIYDTPGFRIGGDPQLTQDIHDMVLELIRPPERLIVCLEQSTVEWANSTSRPIVQTVDPQFQRTILVNTKFDNRCKELRTLEEATKYLEGEDLPHHCPNFFTSLPVERNTSPAQFRNNIDQCYLRDYEHLLRIGIQDQRILSSVGFCHVQAFLEKELLRRYQQAFHPTTEKLEQSVRDLTQQVATLTKAMEEKDPAVLKNRAHTYVHSVCATIERLLAGSAVGEPEKFGQTLSQERSAAGGPSWATLDLGYPIENSARKLYGGPQFQRLLNEFSWIAYSVEFPHATIDEVAAALGTHPTHNVPSYESAASDLVQLKAKQVLHPLVETLTHRCHFIMSRLLEAAMSVLHRDNYDMATIGACEPFRQNVWGAYQTFINHLRAQCKDQLFQDIDNITSIIDWDSLTTDSSSSSITTSGAEGATTTPSIQKEDTKERVHRIMTRRHVPVVPIGREVDDKAHKAFITLCERLFDGIRTRFVQMGRTKLNTCFLKPMFGQMRDTVIEVFRNMPAERYNNVFEAGAKALEVQRNSAQKKLQYATKMRDQFREAGLRLAATVADK